MTTRQADMAVRSEAPAKLNLGLEVVGRRPDGYHEIVTIFQAISIFDSLELVPAPLITVTSTDPSLAGEENLIHTALRLLRLAAGTDQGAAVSLTKRIPVAAGLGGASTDAAAALLAARQLWRAVVTDVGIRDLARQVGSDVPFFLGAGTGLGTGRGDEITALPSLSDVWFVVVSPTIRIPRKTPALYAALQPSDFSDGSAVRQFAAMLRNQVDTPSDLPPNAFARPLYTLHPELAELPAKLAAAGATTIGLSGAGPSHFAVFHDPEAASAVAGRLRASLGDAAKIHLATPVSKPPAPVSTYLG
jgi:4-diphosphocytidyl-2-C-methyl-D-erythritol kinase